VRQKKRQEEPISSSDELIRAGASAELRLLIEERKAEARLGRARSAMEKDRARLHKANERLERSQKGVKAAEDVLREAQMKRAVGPEATG
jgi:outer membrane protein TolC